MVGLEIKKGRDKISAFVPWVGIEPTRPKTLDFESSASTNSATKASWHFQNATAKLTKYFYFQSKNTSIYTLATRINF